MMRRFVTLSLLGAAVALLPGHSPYRQWYAYRATHLVVVTDEMRPGALTVAAAVASAIAARWPETKAVPAAARSPVEVVKLLSSGQLQVGLLPIGCDRDRAHAIAQALAESRGDGPLAKKSLLRGPAPIPFHPGALEYYQGATTRNGG
ncbi:MAG: hypothetical protein E6J65_12960 [Deltaproteobacteria bacterium]|nr:MAG: hypothetical protein E6J65_12960 [Deltaproteobacteria bacterium]